MKEQGDIYTVGKRNFSFHATLVFNSISIHIWIYRNKVDASSFMPKLGPKSSCHRYHDNNKTNTKMMNHQLKSLVQGRPCKTIGTQVLSSTQATELRISTNISHEKNRNMELLANERLNVKSKNCKQKGILQLEEDENDYKKSSYGEVVKTVMITGTDMLNTGITDPNT
ncbi:unnamed protein product [Mytilus edulis]|uniref:Uncharacterized protein n=1 Tax=Mytilus edulis TaxID=6550 RepID=A0A8S3VH46_MYTED|nr:unnamed protein product [Mytilus edulis]